MALIVISRLIFLALCQSITRGFPTDAILAKAWVLLTIKWPSAIYLIVEYMLHLHLICLVFVPWINRIFKEQADVYAKDRKLMLNVNQII
jgi:hypothetical protein